VCAPCALRFKFAVSCCHLAVGRESTPDGDDAGASTVKTNDSSDDVRQFGVANIKSQIKRIKTNEKARQRNKSVRSALKTAIRRVRTAADAGDKETALAELKTASRDLDKAVSKGVIHSNQAANRKSAMAQRVAAL
jgi:small subunit ribosomal protein S20